MWWFITPIYKSGGLNDPVGKLPSYLCLQLPGKIVLFYLWTNDSSNMSCLSIHFTNLKLFFLPNNRTTDRVFTLRTLILDKYVYNHKEKIYARFVDFKKVFDSVWHVGLLHKLFQILPSYLWTFWSMNWWTHLIPVYNSWNLFQLALIFATNY